jgi:hypothetical protein
LKHLAGGLSQTRHPLIAQSAGWLFVPLAACGTFVA